ncbi:MAG TPA: putative leader peptide [Trebonia sp.]|nr:putative leader peptide [Trebonia sp.]
MKATHTGLLTERRHVDLRRQASALCCPPGCPRA